MDFETENHYSKELGFFLNFELADEIMKLWFYFWSSFVFYIHKFF